MHGAVSDYMLAVENDWQPRYPDPHNSRHLVIHKLRPGFGASEGPKAYSLPLSFTDDDHIIMIAPHYLCITNHSAHEWKRPSETPPKCDIYDLLPRMNDQSFLSAPKIEWDHSRTWGRHIMDTPIVKLPCIPANSPSYYYMFA
jgi:hypothetical protein